jgi:molybdopterin-guanine dinucleotide biosynthesis protein A
LKTGGIILAGGKGNRLGLDKAWVELGGQTLLQLAIGKLDGLCHEIIVVAAAGQKLPLVGASVGLKTVIDIASGQGPLVGIYTGLKNSSQQYNVVVACDMPFVSRRLLDHMIKISPGFDVVMPRLLAKLEPLHAVYGRSCLAPIEALLTQGSLKIDRFLDRVRVRYVGEGELVGFDPTMLSFFNINTPDDLARAKELISERQP